MNKELIIEALEVLRERLEIHMDINDAHLSTFFLTKHNEISEEINKLNTNANG